MEVPAKVTLPDALALTTMGLTAHYLCTSAGKIKAGDYVLVHAAGSGTGNLVAQVAQNVCGANVVGTCSTKKLSTANAALASDHVVDYTGFPSSLTQTLRSKTPNNAGFDVVIDGVGKDTAAISLDCAKSRGLVIYFGNASGPVPPIDPLQLSAKGSLFVTRPKLFDYVSTREELTSRANEVFDWYTTGLIKVKICKVYDSLDDVNTALEFVKNGHSNGKVVVRVAGGDDA